MDKKIVFRWFFPAGLLFAAAVVLAHYGMGWLPYPFFVLSLILVIVGVVKLRPGWPWLSGGLAAMALVLRFGARGYAWWGYTLLFAAALIVLHRFLPLKLWRLLLVLVCAGLLYFCFVESFVIRSARTDRDPERDYLIVLGAAVYGDQPSLTLVRRLEGALDYLQSYPESVAIVSGGMGAGETVTEAQAMHDWLIAHGIPEERILLEPRATSTQENLAYSFALIRERGDEPDGHVAVVSSAYHLYRAKLMARNMDVEAAGVAAPWGYFFVMLNYFIREAFGVTHLWVFGY